MTDDPKEYNALSPEEQQVVQYWISKAIRPANSVASSSSYGLKHDYEHESMRYLTNGQFKGAMLSAGYTPVNERAQNWLFKIRPTYDKRRIPHDVSSQIEAGGLPTFRINLMGEPDKELQRLITLVKQSTKS
jgi:hypothetical protein